MMHSVEKKLTLDWPPERWADVTIAVGVSGGADSVALLRVLQRVRTSGVGRIVVCHLNHHLRGAESDQDETFVRNLARELELEIDVGHCHLDPNARDGWEATARAARYAFFEASVQRWGARYLVLAHTADDQAETILHRVIRGTGLAGLAGMPRIRPLEAATLIRPLLHVRRAELRDYLQMLGQSFREDSSNANLAFTRNRLRAEVIPLLESLHPGASQALVRLGHLAGEAQAILEQHAAELYKAAVIETECEIQVQREKLANQPRYLVREVFVMIWNHRGWPQQAMSFEHWEQLAELAQRDFQELPNKVQMFPGRIQVTRRPEELRLRRD